MKQVEWEGDSREVLRSFPEGVRRDLGTGLMYVQCGVIPADARPLKTGMPGTWELRAKDASGQYRVAYVCIVDDQVHVLLCFKKTSAKTAPVDLHTAQLRYKALKQRIRDEKG